MMKERNKEIDFIKGVAIFLVVYGHSIQFLNNGEFDFFKHPLFVFIYSFHMPLFMIISGYLVSHSIRNKEILVIIKSRFERLIIPIISWVILFFIFKTIVKAILGVQENVFIEFLKSIKSIPYTLWFLWGVFYCTMIIAIVHKYLNDNKIVYIGIFILMMLTPDYLNSYLYKFVYPYFIIGYFINDYNKIFNNKTIKIVSFILFIAMLLLWKKQYYIYLSKFTLININIVQQLENILYRGIIGLVGIVVIITLIKYYFKYINCNKINNFVYNMGVNSLGIYIISDYIFVIINKFNIPFINIYLYTLIFTPIASIIIVNICITLCRAINKNKTLSKLLLGNK